MVIGPTQVTYILPHHHQLAKAQGGVGGPGLPHRGIGVHPPAHMQDMWFSTLSTWSMFTTTFFGLSGRPEPEAAGGDEEVQEGRANQVLYLEI